MTALFVPECIMEGEGRVINKQALRSLRPKVLVHGVKYTAEASAISKICQRVRAKRLLSNGKTYHTTLSARLLTHTSPHILLHPRSLPTSEMYF